MKPEVLLIGVVLLFASAGAWGAIRGRSGFSAVDHWNDPVDGQPSPVHPPVYSESPNPFGSGAPKGIRNNNPGNIKHGDNWQGMSAIQNDPTFVQFESMEYGLRALVKLLKNYHSRHGINSVREIIQRWAPHNHENPHHENYVAYVAGIVGMHPDYQMTSIEYEAALPGLARGIVNFENGESWGMQIADGQIYTGISMA